MTVQELQAKLYEMDIPHYYYNICGDGEDEDQRICLASRDGKWLVYYRENGECQDMAEYSDESAACEDCLNRLAKNTLDKSNSTRSNEPTLGSEFDTLRFIQRELK